MHQGLPAWAFAHGPVTALGRLKAAPEDFRVDEVLGFEADGEGPHALLTVEKRGANTRWVAAELARLAGLLPRDVGYAGLKDRHAVTVQHFTVPIEGRPEPDWKAVVSSEYKVLAAARHRRKLKIGSLKGNRFRLTLRELTVPAESLLPKLEAVAARGVPNYFGAQRFGRGGGNLQKAEAMLVEGRRVFDRRLRSLLLSSARSLMFNDLLSARVVAGNWDQLLPGEVLMLDGSRSVFKSVAGDATLARRLAEGDVHPTGPLWGRGELATVDEARRLEESTAAPHAGLVQGLARAGVDMARRALRLPVRELAWEFPDAHTLTLSFFLPAGAYATTVLRELIESDGIVEDTEVIE
ncbi:MAG TPA: tRNA pseudouridine(13) synthase TruD [Gammaproteobacteria bacterium]|nr:tRNA pseudouridine(13) synthase TruD [Gammaproteobacteria bacterium]